VSNFATALKPRHCHLPLLIRREFYSKAELFLNQNALTSSFPCFAALGYNGYGCANKDFDLLSNSCSLGTKSGRKKFDLSPEWPGIQRGFNPAGIWGRGEE